MNKISTVIATGILTLVMAMGAISVNALAANTPPGPGSSNPALQPDGIQVPDVFGSTSNWNLSPPLRKFVDTLAPLGCAATNNLGQCIPVAVPDKLTFPGSDYYEIELRRYTEKLHTDLPNNTTLRGYVQVNSGTNQAGTANDVAPAPIHYLGPVIVAQKGRPVRIKFVNKLPLESVEPFFLPVDRSVMGSGMGTKKETTPGNYVDCDPVWDPRGRNGLPTTEPTCTNYSANRAELHLHGGLNPWISDGTPHQWITPAGENTPYKKGDSVEYVPDMWFDVDGNVIPSCAGQLTCAAGGASNNPGPGAQTYYYTNDQSARFMFYHDHAFGITRLNVYAGEAAGYLIQDPTEADLVNRGVIPAEQIPLVIQDKGFVDPATIETLDPTWVWGTGAKTTKWLSSTGAEVTACAGQSACADPSARKMLVVTPKAGDLWWPHVYMPAENPADLGGVNPMGRWVYGMYFWPPTTGIKFLPVSNPYYDCDPLGVCNAPWEPPTTPATPNPSWTAEAFLDTPMVNGTIYPTLDVQPKSYRLRILNAGHDRFLNLQLYEADGSVDPNMVNPQCVSMGGCAANTEVRMVPAIKYPAFPLWDAAADQRAGGVPDPATSGPAWIQIGNEGGFLPTPVVIPNQPISYVMDPTLFNVGNVNDGTVILGPAERADVIIDFSQYAGKTLILYNDAPAAFPAFVPNNDYYTGAPDLTGTGGHPGPRAGIGPNTRTIMQIKVAATTPAAPFDLNRLLNEFTTTPTQDSVFKKSQEPVIVGQTAYDSAYNTLFPSVAPYWGIVNIGDQKMSFTTLNPAMDWSKEVVSQYPLEPKALHDEMGAVWDEYGRMSAKLGVELPNTTNINQIFVMQNYVDPPTENMQDGKVQIWKLTHNGVDTHPLHFHLFDVQVINRVGWDGFVRLPWPNELGWKETVRVSPLEDTIVAIRPKAPPVPWKMNQSNRLMNPAYPVGTTDGFMNLDPVTGQAKAIPDTNQNRLYFDEYVWHCHILSHEEQDMMRALTLQYPVAAPLDPTGFTVAAGFQKNILAWTDESYKYVLSVANPPQMPPSNNIAQKFFVERCSGACDGTGNFSKIAEITMIPSASLSYNDGTIAPGAVYTYRIRGYNRYTTDNNDGTRTRNDGFTNYVYAGPVTSQSWPQANNVTVEVTTVTAPTTTLCAVNQSVCAAPFEAPAKFVAQASGSTAPYQYRFSLNNGSMTTVVQDYSATRYWILPGGFTPGNYTMIVDVRTNAASATPDVTSTLAFTLRATLDTTPPVTTAIPPAGAFLNPVQVYLQVDEPGSVIRYTIDGTAPSQGNGYIYTAPINVSATTTLQYYATDPAGNAEVVKTGIYELRPAALNAIVTINGGAAYTNTVNVTLTISATGATQMQFSNTGNVNAPAEWSPEEPYAATKNWTLSPGDGPKTVYVRFRDSSNILQSSVPVQIVLDTLPPVTTPLPAPGTYLTSVVVTLSAGDPSAVIRYSLDGSDPTLPANDIVYTGPFTVAATTAVKYFATDSAGNSEAVKTAIYTIHKGNLTVGTFNINGGVSLANTTAVTLNIGATEPTGVTKMRFSNDGVTYTVDEPYATAKAWTLAAGDGVKNVYVRFTDGAGLLYDAATAQIVLDMTPPITTIFPPPSGVYVNPINVALTANETGSIIEYTVDGTDPSTSVSAIAYTGPITLSANTVLRYRARDLAGNPEPVQTAAYSFTTSSIPASLTINSGALRTNNPTVTLDVSATGATLMQFSNDGVNYSAAVAYAPVSVPWVLDPADGLKTVFARFTNDSGFVLNLVSAQITLDVTAPQTAVFPAPGTFLNSVSVTLAASEPGSTIRYTLDGSDPVTSVTSATYSGPIGINATTTLKYFATDATGNREAVKSGTYTITASTINAFVAINGGATVTNNATVSLALSAIGVDRMSFSNNGTSYSTPEPYAATKAWTLSNGDGVKNVYVRFHDAVNNLTYDPVIAQIVLDTAAPTTTATPAAPAKFIDGVTVALTASEPGSTIRYTLDGSDPGISTTALLYTAPVSLVSTATLRYFATDIAGNAETPKSGTYTITAATINASVAINGGATVSNNATVNLTLSATGVDRMSFSNNGISYSAPEAYAVTKAWNLSVGDGVKNVYVRFHDTANNLTYDPVIAQIVLDTAAPTTTATPAAPATFINGVNLVLFANEPGSTIRYTLDGSDPATSATTAIYGGPISVNATTTLKYFATDMAGNREAVKSGIYTITTSTINATVAINGGSTVTNNATVSLALSATGVDWMSFSNNGISYSTPEPYAATKAWTLSAGDGVKNVYVRFHDTANNLTYDPVIAQIVLDTVAPTTTATPAAPAIFINGVSVALTTGEPGSTIRYTLDGSDPVTSPTGLIYTAPINLVSTATLRYFATDMAGNAEAVKSGLYTVHSEDLSVNAFQINGGAATTATPNVTLAIDATDAMGVSKMRFSNDGVNYSPDEPYAASKNWTLSVGDGAKTVFVRFTDGAGILYSPATAQIVLDTLTPTTSASPAAPATFINGVNVVLFASEPGSTIRYTLDGSDPVTSATTAIYSGPINITTTTTIRYFATDVTGNKESVKSGTYTITASTINASVAINGGAAVTDNTAVDLTLSATGVDRMSFSNNGVTYTTPETYAQTKSWTIGTGDGIKTVFVRFHDTTQSPPLIYDPVIAMITLDTVPPATTASPAPGIFISQVNVALAASEPGSTIRYTLDGSDPASSATALIYAAPISLTSTATLRYFATDAAGNAEAAKSGLYTVHSADLMVNTFQINGGAATTTTQNITLDIDATDAMGVSMMRFSNDGVNYSPDEPYTTGKNWTLSAGDGVKTVFVRFTDGAGILYNPATAHILLDTAAPTTTATPAPATYISMVSVALATSEPGSTIRYTLDGSDPTTSATGLIYTAPINLLATATLRYFATDAAGNTEIPKSGLYTVHSEDLTVNTFRINGGAATTTTRNVTLAIDATDAMGVSKMRFSNDGVNYSPDEPYAAGKNWTLSPGDGVKTVFVRFTDGAGILYNPTTAQIVLDTVAPTTNASPAPAKFINGATVALSASESGSTIRYTLDGSDPATSATAAIYSGPININATTTLKYFASDVAGNREAVKSGTYTITASTINASVAINGSSTVTNNATVDLTLSATGVDMMSFSNNGVSYSTPEAYAVTKVWTLSVGDGVKNVYVRFHDTANNLTYDPMIAQITLDTVPPATTASPAPGIFISQVNVALSASEPGSTIRYTLDGSNPVTSATGLIYTAPINLLATATLRYFATDAAGNTEIPKSGLYTVHSADLKVNAFRINGGAATTTTQNVTLAIDATDAMGVSKMRFSNDGVNYSPDEPYATGKNWTLSPGDGVKTVFVRFTDGAGILYNPTTAQIVLDTVAPTTNASPAPAKFINGVTVTLSASESGSTIRYTLDGSDPATSATAAIYSGPININATTTLKYFATDVAGNKENVKSGTYTITASTINASVAINGGTTVTNNATVDLTLSATGVDMMSFSNNGTSYSTPEPYAVTKVWTLSVGDGVKNVYVRFHDTANNLTYDPMIAQITLDTVPPATTASPAPGIFISQVNVALSASEPGSTIRYTLDGSDPATSATGLIYTAPVSLTSTVTLRYFATDAAGNTEATKSGLYTVHSEDLAVNTFRINGGAATTTTQNVTLAIDATDAMGVSKMRFSNDGVNYSPDEPYATGKNWTLSPGDGVKTVFVRFTDGAGILYNPTTAQIVLDTVAPATTVTPAPATYISQVSVALATSEPGAAIRYTTDGTDPTVSPTAALYGGPIILTTTTSLRYFATDAAGNGELPKSGLYTVHSEDLVVNSFRINDGAATTITWSVTLAIDAADAMGVSKMRFSNDGVNYSPDEPYATGKSWTLSAGDGVKTVFVRFTDGAGILYNPTTAQIVLDTVAPTTSASPASAKFINGVNVALSANEPGSIVRYTLDGSDPVTSATGVVYSGPISINATSTIRYFATDVAGNKETVKSGTYTITGSTLNATVTINGGGAVTNNAMVNLALSANGVDKMSFSNNGVNYTTPEAYAAAKAWALTAGDGVKTVFVRFHDTANDLTYDPVTAQIALDTIPPVSAISPDSGTFVAAVTATIAVDDPSATVRYTLDGSDPKTSGTAVVATGPINVTATATLKYYASDAAGNAEAVKSAVYTIHAADLSLRTFVINDGVALTTSTTVTLTIDAIDPLGIATMQFSNDGISFSDEEPYASTKVWSLIPGDGHKTVYVRFRDKALPSGHLYGPFSTSINFAAKDGLYPGTTGYLNSALQALQIANGFSTPSVIDLAHCDVAPYDRARGGMLPDGRIDLLDVYAILSRLVGLPAGF